MGNVGSVIGDAFKLFGTAIVGTAKTVLNPLGTLIGAFVSDEDKQSLAGDAGGIGSQILGFMDSIPDIFDVFHSLSNFIDKHGDESSSFQRGLSSAFNTVSELPQTIKGSVLGRLEERQEQGLLTGSPASALTPAEQDLFKLGFQVVSGFTKRAAAGQSNTSLAPNITDMTHHATREFRQPSLMGDTEERALREAAGLSLEPTHPFTALNRDFDKRMDIARVMSGRATGVVPPGAALGPTQTPRPAVTPRSLTGAGGEAPIAPRGADAFEIGVRF